MAVIGPADEDQLAENLARQRALSSSLLADSHALQKAIDHAGRGFPFGAEFDFVTSAVVLRIEERGGRVTVEIDDRARQALTAAGLRDAFAFSFAKTPFHVDIAALTQFISTGQGSRTSQVGFGAEAPERRFDDPGGQLSLITVFGRPARIAATDSWLMSEPSRSLAHRVALLLEAVRHTTHKGAKDE